MSHLSTIISRVRHKVRVYNNNLEEVSQDSIFEQAVINLMEYLKAWKDMSALEINEAKGLYDLYRPYLNDKGMPSHAQRLKEADTIRLGLEEPEPIPKISEGLI